MKIPEVVLVVAASFFGCEAMAQQTGVAVGTTPGSAARMRITAAKVILKPTCETAPGAAGGEVSSVPEMLFGRSFNELECIRHADGRTEQFQSDLPKGIASADGSAVAYWNSQKHELHVFLAASHSDVVVENLPGANLRDMAWSAKGRMLSYFPTSASPAGIRSYDADTGKFILFGGSFVGVVAPPDAQHVAAIDIDGVKSFSLPDATSQITARVKYAVSVEYSRGGKYLGILSNLRIAEQNAPPAAPVPASAQEDDTPDCGGGSLALILQDTKTRQLVDVPYPKGFDTALDFSFSPDENTIAVTFGVAGCDYPGDRAQVFLVSLPDLKLTPVSPEDRLSVKPVWTPDAKVIVYSDYTGSDSPLVAFELATHKITKLTTPGQFGPDEWLSWRK